MICANGHAKPVDSLININELGISDGIAVVATNNCGAASNILRSVTLERNDKSKKRQHGSVCH